MVSNTVLRVWLVCAGMMVGSMLPGVAQNGPPKEITFQVFAKGALYTPVSTAIPPPKPVQIKPGSTVTTFPNGAATILNPLTSLELPANTVPFTLTTSGQILLSARVGTHTLALALDSGASSTGLLPASAAKLGVRLDTHPHTGPEVKFGTLPEVALSGIQLKAVPIVVTELAALTAWNGQHPAQKIDGILGIDTLQQWGIGLDMLAQTLTFWPGGHVNQDQIIAFQIAGLQRYALRPTHQEFIQSHLAAAMPMHHKAGDENHPFYSVTVRVDQIDTEMDVDTGALISTIPDKIALELKPLVTSQAVVRTLNGDVPMPTMTLRRLKVGPLTVDYPLVALCSPTTPKEFATSILGRTCFDRCQVILDFPASTLLVARLVEGSNARLLLPALGIFPRSQEERLTVLVQPGSAAAEAGMRDGDEIVHVEETTPLLPGSPQADPEAPTDLTLTIRHSRNAPPIKVGLRVLRISKSLSGRPVTFPEGGRLYLPGRSGGIVLKPNSKVIPAIDYLLVFNPKPPEAPPTKSGTKP